MLKNSELLNFPDLEQWLNEHRVTEIECLVPDLTGVARGKILPREKFTEDRGMRLPEAIVAMGVTGRARFEVNSVHGQAVNRLADGLRVEARSPDGVVEAFSVPAAKGFNLCVQWHPEWMAADNPVSMQMLTAFGEACRRYREGRRGPHP